MIVGALTAMVGALAIGLKRDFMSKSNQQIEVLRTSLRQIDKFPDPAEIDKAGKWYLLNHISSPLIEYDHKNSSFLPLIAKSWEIVGSKYIIKLDPDAKFSDGSSIRARDVVASIKRILAKKTSLHFPLWNHVADCENLKTLDELCHGISGDDASNTVEVNLLTKSESFLLQISSPEGGIWSADDINPATLELKPTRFSGPYSLNNLVMDANHELVLTRNPYSKIQNKFPDSPKKIRVKSMGRAEVEKSIVDGNTDVFIGDFIPCNDYDWEQMEVGLHYTLPSSIIYFFKLNTNKHIGRDLLQSLEKVPDHRLTFAETLLPFAPSIALTRDEVNSLLPAQSSLDLVVAAPGFYYKDKFLAFVEKAAHEAGINLKIEKVEPAEYSELIQSNENFKSKYDFVIGNYVASERYPAVQLRFLTGKRNPGVDLMGVEAPEQDSTKIKKLKDYEKWLLSSQTVIPFYFTRTHIVYSKKLDIGEQPVTDADIQLWRVTEKML